MKVTAEKLGMILMVEQNKTDVRYFACGYMDENGLTGIVHGYEGGGEYSSWLFYNGEYITESTFNKDFDYDNSDDEDLIDEFSCASDALCEAIGDPDFEETIWNFVEEYIVWDDANCSYYLKDDMKPVFENTNIAWTGAEIEAVDYCNTTFSRDSETGLEKLIEVLKK